MPVGRRSRGVERRLSERVAVRQPPGRNPRKRGNQQRTKRVPLEGGMKTRQRTRSASVVLGASCEGKTSPTCIIPSRQGPPFLGTASSLDVRRRRARRRPRTAMPWASGTRARQPPIKAAVASAMADSRSQHTEESADQCEYRHDMGYLVGAVHAVRSHTTPRSLRGLRRRPEPPTWVASAATAAAMLHHGLRLRHGNLTRIRPCFAARLPL
ncbi:hypothetical protein MRX96_015108 [Rhipicephalus microplus]